MPLKKLIILVIFLLPLNVMAVDEYDDEEPATATPAQIEQQAKELTRQPQRQQRAAQSEQSVMLTAVALKEFYDWFNEIGDPRNPLTMEDIEYFYTPTAFMNVNGNMVAKSRQEFFIYLQSLRANYKSMRIALPFADTVISGDKAAVRYIINAIGNDDKPYKISLISIIKFANGLVSEFAVVASKEAVTTSESHV